MPYLVIEGTYHLVGRAKAGKESGFEPKWGLDAVRQGVVLADEMGLVQNQHRQAFHDVGRGWV